MISWGKRSYTKDTFIEAWNTSLSIAECARKLNLAKYGSTYETLKKTANELGLNKDHMSGKGWNTKKIRTNNGTPLTELMVKDSTYSRGSLKRRILSENILAYKCVICGISDWLGNNLTLHLDHINGVNNDHRLENLRFLCPNCHSQTNTYTGRNKPKAEKKKKTIPEENKTKHYCSCGNQKNQRAKSCLDCYNRAKSSNIPSEEVLLESLNKHNWVYAKACIDFNVSGNTIGKWVKRYNLTK